MGDAQGVWHVAVWGDDQASGRTARRGDPAEGPVATLARAVALARQAAPGTPRTIFLADGTWHDVQLTLEPADSGLTLAAAPGAAPVLAGGRPVTGWQPLDEQRWAAPLPGVADGSWDFRALLVNGELRPRARFPATGKLTHRSRFPVRWMSTTKGGWERKPTDEELTTAVVDPADLPPGLDLANAEVTFYHSWDESLVGLASYDPATGAMRFRNPAGHPPGAFCGWKEHTVQYVVWNLAEGLTAPGQWFLDRRHGRVVYWPLPGEELARLTVLAPTQPSVIRLAGTAAAPVTDVTLRGLTLTCTTTPLVAGGFGALAFAGALEGEQVQRLTLDRLTVRGAGGQAIRLKQADRLTVTRCHLHDCGAGGLIVQGRTVAVSDCTLHHVGRTYPSSIALRAAGDEHTISHNLIHHTPYSAICGGGRHQRYTHNRFHHVMEELVDGAAIYLFAAKESLIAGNHTDQVRDEQVHAYYLDEQSADSVVEGNLAVDVPWPLHHHMASRCVVRDNVCIARGALHLSFINCADFRVERNVFMAGTSLTIDSSYTGLAGGLADNLCVVPQGQVHWHWHDRLPSLERSAAPVPLLPPDAGSVLTADSPFVDAAAGDLTFRPESPAAALGLLPLDVTQAGPRPE